MRTLLATGIAATLAATGAVRAVTVPGVYDTGVDAFGVPLAGGNGVADPHYTIAGGTGYSGVIGAPAKTFDEFGWFMPASPTAKAVNASGSGDAAWDASIIVRTTFDMTGYSLTSAALSGTVQADDAAEVLLNGHSIGSAADYYHPVRIATASPAYFVAGLNTLDFVVHNDGGHTAVSVDQLLVTADEDPGDLPEPTTWALLVTGFGLVGATQRRRSARAVMPALSR